MPQKSICIGQITTAHGVRGLAKLRSFTEPRENIFSYSPVTDETGERIFDIEKRGNDKENFIVAIKNIETRDEIEKLRGTNLYVQRSALPALDKGYYHADLIGLDVLDMENNKIGTVKAVHNFGTGDILEIEGTDKKSFMIIFNETNVPKVDLANRQITIDRPAEI